MAGGYTGGYTTGYGSPAVLEAPVTAPARAYGQRLWQVDVGAHGGGPASHPVDTQQLRGVWRLDGHAEVSVDTDGRSSHVGSIGDFNTDLFVSRDGQRLHRGVIVPSDTVDGDGHTTTLASYDYRWRLGSRTILDTLDFDQVDQETIGWGVIDHLQAQVGGNLGIVRNPARDVSKLRDRTYEPGDNAAQRLDELGRVRDSHDWEIGPDLVFRTWPNGRGRQGVTTLILGGNVDRAERQADVGTFANAVRVTGDDTTVPAVALADDLASTSRLRWDTNISASSTTRQSSVDSHAAGQVIQRSKVAAGWKVTLSSGWWAPERLWLGDTIRLIVRSGRLDVDTTVRVVEVSVDVDLTSGAETVSASLDAPPPDMASQWRRLVRRLNELEQR